MERLRSLARGYALEALIAAVAVEGSRLYAGEMTTGTPEGGGFLLRVRLSLSGQPR